MDTLEGRSETLQIVLLQPSPGVNRNGDGLKIYTGYFKTLIALTYPALAA
jgi:hypothetical protein